MKYYGHGLRARDENSEEGKRAKGLKQQSQCKCEGLDGRRIIGVRLSEFMGTLSPCDTQSITLTSGVRLYVLYLHRYYMASPSPVYYMYVMVD
jgi:hypothetical protein